MTPRLAREIDYIVDNFDFVKVRAIMTTLNWGWAATEGKPPSIPVMKEFVYNNLHRLVEEMFDNKKKRLTASTGGFLFEISRERKKSKVVWMRVSFVLTDWDNW